MGKFVGYRTIANVSPLTDAPNARLIETDYIGMIDAKVDAHQIAAASVRKSTNAPRVNWVIAQVARQNEVSIEWVTVEVIVLSIDGSRIIQVTSAKADWYSNFGIAFDLGTDDDDFAPQLSTAPFGSDDSYTPSANGHDYLGDMGIQLANEVMAEVDTNCGIVDTPSFIPAPHGAAYNLPWGSMAQIPHLPSGESNAIRADVRIFFGHDYADRCVIKWQRLPHGDSYGWIVDLPSGEQLQWANGRLHAMGSRAKLTTAQVNELMKQLNCFVEVVNSAWDSNDLDRAEVASVYAMGISKILG